MYFGRYAPWDRFPRFLRFSEVQDPMRVLVRFFDDRGESCRKELKMWRDFSVSDDQFKDKRNGSGMLLMIYEQNIQLVEACYMQYMGYREEPWTKKGLTDEVLADGKERWPFFPGDLSETFLHNPYLLLRKLFKEITLPQFRDYLNEWTHAALSTYPIDENLMPKEVIAVYENMLLLYSAAWLIRQKEGDAPVLKREYWDEEASVDPVASASSLEDTNKQELLENQATPELSLGKIELRPFAPLPTQAERMSLKLVADEMLRLVPTIRSISYLGSRPDPFTFYLLVLVGNEEKTPEHSLIGKLEDGLRALVQLCVIVHKVGVAIQGLKSRGMFWNLAFEKGIELYRSEELLLPELGKIGPSNRLAVRMASWNKYGVMGLEFFRGAERYLEERNAKLALFLLHQATEHILTAVLQALFGYRQQTHNLLRLLRLTRLFTDAFSDIFERDAKNGVKVLTLINNGYNRTRFDDHFIIDENLLKIAFEKVRLLTDKARLVYKSDNKEPVNNE